MNYNNQRDPSFSLEYNIIMYIIPNKNRYFDVFHKYQKIPFAYKSSSN